MATDGVSSGEETVASRVREAITPGAMRGLDIARRVSRSGPKLVAREAAARLNSRLGGHTESLPLPVQDILVAERTPLPGAPGIASMRQGAKGRVAWVCTPPGPGSGGHTTFFRMISAVQSHGHDCVLYLFDRHNGAVQRHASVVRRHWPELRVSIRDPKDGIRGVDACVASSWETAYVVAARTEPHVRRLYFIQDYEPYFYPRGSLYALAENTYRLGFRHIALGGMVADLLESELGVRSDTVTFGCDTSVYHPLKGSPRRSGVVFFARRDTPRRGYLLGTLGLELFHRRHPEVDIHVYGADSGRLTVPTTQHGRLTPPELNALYNRTVAGLSLSFTNVTLVAEEMLAAGTIPVANESSLSRPGLDNPHVLWTAPSPEGIAKGLQALVVDADEAEIESRAARAASRVRSGWGSTGRAVTRIIEEELYGAAPKPDIRVDR